MLGGRRDGEGFFCRRDVLQWPSAFIVMHHDENHAHNIHDKIFKNFYTIILLNFNFNRNALVWENLSPNIVRLHDHELQRRQPRRAPASRYRDVLRMGPGGAPRGGAAGASASLATRARRLIRHGARVPVRIGLGISTLSRRPALEDSEDDDDIIGGSDDDDMESVSLPLFYVSKEAPSTARRR